MAKIVIIGAGSGFGSRLSIDILSRESLKDSTIALCDIDEERLEGVRSYVQRAVDGHNLPGKVVAATDREQLLPGADCVVTAVSIGGAAYWGEPYRSEVEIPMKFGVQQTVADTIGVGGIFRFLRTADEHLQFALDMERLCPQALLLNYTNPMCMLTWLHSVGTTIENVGLCHSVQGTTKKLTAAVGAPYDEVSYTVAGINHQAWVLSLQHRGEDLYPALWQAIDSHESFEQDKVRVEMMRQFGYFVTESTRHNAEYLPYFRRTTELCDFYGVPQRNPVSMENIRKRDWMKDSGVEDDGEDDVPPLTASHEYASLIIEARMENTPFAFNGNVMNNGSIPNLPEDCCVEVPCLADAEGVHATFVGDLPTQCAALNRTNVSVQELAVEAVLNRDREAAFHACALDPLTAAVVPLPQIREMFEELWTAEGDLLSYFDA
ncbi:MAG TPA: alpha-galactosidase [Candidatus Latescibacteria bacterium]|nr:alpha-glucosidase/alpha-galactosidase [Gemmatimonadaceae bacterium]MDP6019324.1 alpha-galactosidase [Candidatus Latescibacterota bacterium]HJP32691.1 alpha-galactosidase [Candidatus Latescibacterota bacterium]